MNWLIPAKTFLLGEYSALADNAALIATTSPFFTCTLTETNTLEGMNKTSPAAKWWIENVLKEQGLKFYDPYDEKGGLGASTAQFLGAYLAYAHLSNQKPNWNTLLTSYYQYAWNGQGLKPSAYDLLAQSRNQCVYINRKNKSLHSLNWEFSDIAFLLLHSGQKLPTHRHLQTVQLPYNLSDFSNIVNKARDALINKDSESMMHAVNSYHQLLKQAGLVAHNSLKNIEKIKSEFENILAIKGCGAMGSDVILLIVPQKELEPLKVKLIKKSWTILATNHNLYQGEPLLSEIF